MLVSNSWLFLGRVSRGQPATVRPACQWGLPFTREWPSSAHVGWPFTPLVHDLPAPAAPAATVSRRRPCAQAWFARAFMASS